MPFDTSLSDAAWAMRSRAAAGESRRPAIEGREGRPGQAMLKVIGRGRKSRAGVRALVAYVERSSPKFLREGHAPLPLCDEAGDAAGPGREALAGWELVSDLDNLSRAARGIVAEAGPEAPSQVHAMPERERFQHVQAWHIIVSVPEDPAEPRARTLTRLEEAVRGFVGEAFAEEGHRAIWTVHQDGAAPHAHIVVQARSRFGRRLRFDRRGEMSDSLREVFTRHARACDINVTAERRADRQEVRDAILDGREPLRPSKDMVEVRKGVRHLPIVAPRWWLQYGPDYEDRMEAARTGRRERKARGEALPRPAMVRSPASSDHGEVVAAVFRRLYRDPVAALVSYAEMAAEGAVPGARTPGQAWPNRSMASWYLRNRSEAFGDLNPGVAFPGPDPALRRSLRRLTPEQLLPGVSVGRSAHESRGLADMDLLDRALRAINERRRRRGLAQDREHMIRVIARLAEITAVRLGPEAPRTVALQGLAVRIASQPVPEAANQNAPAKRSVMEWLGRMLGRGGRAPERGRAR